MSRAAVFLDRDGTMIEDVGYLNRVEDLRVFPWTVDAIRSLNRAGFLVVVVTNQSAIARGVLTEEGLAEIHAHLDEMLAAEGAKVTAYYYCPHHPEGPVAAYAMGAGLAIASANPIAAGLIALYLAVTLRAAIRNEEAFLRRTFGEQYHRYRSERVFDHDRRFSVAQAMANKEYRALAGLIAAMLLLVLKATYNETFWRAAGP